MIFIYRDAYIHIKLYIFIKIGAYRFTDSSSPFTMTNIHPAYLAPCRPHRVVVAEVIGSPRWRHRLKCCGWRRGLRTRHEWHGSNARQEGLTYERLRVTQVLCSTPVLAMYARYFYYLDIPWYTQIILEYPRSTWAWWRKLMNMVKTGQIPFHDLLAPVPGLTAWHLQSLGRKKTFWAVSCWMIWIDIWKYLVNIWSELSSNILNIEHYRTLLSFRRCFIARWPAYFGDWLKLSTSDTCDKIRSIALPQLLYVPPASAKIIAVGQLFW